MQIRTDDLSGPEIRALLQEHLDSMYALSPPESVHALDITQLRAPGISFWTAWDGPLLLGCGALKQLDAHHGELKSMRTPAAHRGRGAGRALLQHILQVAKTRGYARLSLETGTAEAFHPAQKLYASVGFSFCGPFAHYRENPHSVFMALDL
ncbi:GNAT family N-acetyltransferase [Rhodoferax sp. WC2427]|uniref:GNAT family N-acetyltransferase n=1 Tax=Rhodoferax sp. WC2427 TaxID=3234144 RepID=UPI003466E18D